MKKAGLNGYVYKFNVGYNPFNPSSINKIMPNIHNYFMAKYYIKWKYLDLLKKYF